MLRCPKTRSKLELENGKLINRNGHSFDIINNIPVFVEDKDAVSKRELHESLADAYSHLEQLKGITGFFYNMYIKQTIDFIKKYKPKLLLDIGGGEGAIFSKFKYSRFIVDISLRRLIRNKDEGSLKFRADGMNLPFEDELFDAALLIAVLEHTMNPIQMVSETARVLKRGGKVAVLVPNDINKSIGRILIGKSAPRSPGHLYFFTPTKLLYMIKNNFKLITGFRKHIDM